MIPIVPLGSALKIIHIFLHFIWHHRKRSIQNNVNDDLELVNLLQLLSNIRHDCLSYFALVHKFQQLQQCRKRKTLSKPHFLISLLRGYQSRVHNRDVWINLEQNWSHFFWLTGETPQTLEILINRVESKFLNCRNSGPDSNLNLRNKVSNYFEVHVKHIFIGNILENFTCLLIRNVYILDIINNDMVKVLSYYAHLGNDFWTSCQFCSQNYS